MPADGTDLPTEALEDVAYLSRSANRVRILDALASGAFDRRELADLTGTSRTTLDRIVNELEARGWAERTSEGTYAATVQGSLFMREFRPFLNAAAAIRRLDGALTWLPLEELSIGLEHFSDAVVRKPESDDPVEAVEFMADLLRDATEFRVLSHLVPPDPLGEILADRLSDRQLHMDAVATEDLVAYLAARPERAERWRRMLESGAAVYRHEGPLPCNLWVLDETVLIKKSGPEPIDESYGVPIVTRDETVREWAHGLIDEWIATGTRVEPGFLGEEASG